MAGLDKPEWPPLLAPGFCPMAVEDLRALCVGSFRLSSTRAGIMSSLEAVLARLQGAKIEGNLWIDGSFLTEKIDPQDVDMVLELENEFLARTSAEQQETINWFTTLEWGASKCDAYAFTRYPQGHPLYWEGHNKIAEWHRQFGFSRGRDFKGIAVIELRVP